MSISHSVSKKQTSSSSSRVKSTGISQQPPVSSTEQTSSSSSSGSDARLYWGMLGYMILIGCALVLINQGPKYTVLDIAYGLVALSLPVVRYLDIRYWGGNTFYGEKATMKDWVRYTLLVVVASVLGWFGAHAVASYFPATGG